MRPKERQKAIEREENCVLWHFHEGLSYQQIADRLGNYGKYRVRQLIQRYLKHNGQPWVDRCHD